MISLRSIGVAIVCALWASTALAQAPSQQTQTPDSTDASRPATNTFSGDTGLWYVPTAEVLEKSEWSAGLYRAGFNYVEGFSNVSDIAATFAYGVARKMELFGSFKVDTRIDRDLRPIFTSNPEVGGIISSYPRVTQGWTGDNIGDFLIGVKYNLLSEADQKSRRRCRSRVPQAADRRRRLRSEHRQARRELRPRGQQGSQSQRVEVAGYGGFAFRGSPDGSNQPNAFRWGFGAGFPSRGALRVTGELHGEMPFDDTVTLTAPLVATDGSIAPFTSTLNSFTATTLGLTWQHSNGFFIGGGLSWTFPTEDRDDFNTDEDQSGDFVDYQVRLGFHPGVRRYVPPPPPPPPPPPVAAPANRPPTVTARCEPCTIEVGRTVTVTADAQDPDGDTLTYRWTGPSGTFTNPTDRQTIWTAPQTGRSRAAHRRGQRRQGRHGQRDGHHSGGAADAGRRS